MSLKGAGVGECWGHVRGLRRHDALDILQMEGRTGAKCGKSGLRLPLQGKRYMKGFVC